MIDVPDDYTLVKQSRPGAQKRRRTIITADNIMIILKQKDQKLELLNVQIVVVNTSLKVIQMKQMLFKVVINKNITIGQRIIVLGGYAILVVYD